MTGHEGLRIENKYSLLHLASLGAGLCGHANTIFTTVYHLWHVFNFSVAIQRECFAMPICKA